MTLSRRNFVQALTLAPLGALGCSPPPKTPLANLDGQQWVRGVYELDAKHYLDVQMGAETSSHGVYRVLAQKGVSALAGLQSREVPFFISVNDKTNAFKVKRTIPERLTFDADMTQAEREAATSAWDKARAHIQTDYFEIHRLNWALTTLLEQLIRIHSAMDNAEIQQFKIVRQLAELRDGGAPPYRLPHHVTRTDYVDVLLLLLARLEDDRHRLAVIEASIAAVGLCARSTDAGSGSLAANIESVMLSVIRDAKATRPIPARYPREQATRRERLAIGRKLAAQIEASPDYLAWKEREENKDLDKIAALLTVIDSVTHLPTSAVFHAVIDIWRGHGDYLNYLEALANMVPGGGELSKTVVRAVEITKRARSVVEVVRDRHKLEQAIEKRAQALLNVETEFGRARLQRQLSFYEDKADLDGVREDIRSTELLKERMPDIPKLPARP